MSYLQQWQDLAPGAAIETDAQGNHYLVVPGFSGDEPLVAFRQKASATSSAGAPASVKDPFGVATTTTPTTTPAPQAFSNLSTVTITHNLGRYVEVQVLDTSGRLIEGQVTQLSLNQVEIQFSQSLSGAVLVR